jgi:hypothetical protein
MASRFRRSALAVNTEASGLGALLNGGTLEIYDGDQPASIATAITTQVLLARLTFGDPAFKTPVDGSITAVPITDDPNAAATGRARFFIARTAAGAIVFDGSAGADGDGCDCTVIPVDVEQGARVKVKAMVYVASRGAA